MNDIAPSIAIHAYMPCLLILCHFSNTIITMKGVSICVSHCTVPCLRMTDTICGQCLFIVIIDCIMNNAVCKHISDNAFLIHNTLSTYFLSLSNQLQTMQGVRLNNIVFCIVP